MKSKRANLIIQIPESFHSKLFFLDFTVQVNMKKTFKEHIKEDLFLYDLLFKLKKPIDYKPWKDRENSVPILFEVWQEQKDILTELFKKRDKHTSQKLMVQQIAVFLEALFWANQKPVNSLVTWKEEVKSLTIKPVNLIERFEFIMNGPDHYHSFIQLSQLFDELLKQFQKSIHLNEKKTC